MTKCIIDEIKTQRKQLEDYIAEHPIFKTALIPISVTSDAPEIARWMQRASEKVNIGPMAAVAGAIAEFAARTALTKGATEAIVDNGGDIFIASDEEVRVGLFAGNNRISDKLVLVIPPSYMPLAVCSSSSLMGHSMSLGRCDLATVVARDTALADAAATRACNLVKEEADIKSALETIMDIHGIMGILIVKNGRTGMVGDLPDFLQKKT
jgi:ApbE superfamily uncharacterized protein (UPF0280 family)